VRPVSSVQGGTRVADADVVEDGLTEDVPSSMVGYQKLRGGALVRGQEPRLFWEGDRVAGAMWAASVLVIFLRRLERKGRRKIDRK